MTSKRKVQEANKLADKLLKESQNNRHPALEFLFKGVTIPTWQIIAGAGFVLLMLSDLRLF